MKRRNFVIAVLLSGLVCAGFAQKANEGGISSEMLSQIKKTYTNNAADKAVRNVLNNNDINKVAKNAENATAFDSYFSNKVNSKAITNQKSSGRCWLFTGLNVFRADAIAKHNLSSDFQFSQVYTFFWDQLEKSNLFLQAIIDTRKEDMTSKTVEWLFKNPLSDGGQFTGVSDLLTKYGVVPSDVMPETNSSNNTSRMAQLISLKLREFGLELREMGADKKTTMATMQKRKTEMLGVVYRMLALNFGEPPTEFTWTQKDASGKPISTKKYTPKSFYDEFIGKDLSQYVMIMNDPTRDYYKVYEIEYDRHVYDGYNWKYINLPMEDIKPIAISVIKDSTMMYFSCDVGKFLDSEKGWLDINNYDYESLMGTTFGMNKKQRVATFASGSAHAMTLCAVDLDENGKPKKWMVENSWGSSYGHNGFLIMTDQWFDEYMFRLVVEKKYIPSNIASMLDQKPIMLPAWDPMFANEVDE